MYFRISAAQKERCGCEVGILVFSGALMAVREHAGIECASVGFCRYDSLDGRADLGWSAEGGLP